MDVLQRECVVVVAVELAPTFGATDLYEGLDEESLVAVAGLLVVLEPAGDGAKQVGGEVGNVHPTCDGEAGVVDHEMQAGLALLCTPADVVVTVFERPGRSSEADRGYRSPACGHDQIA